MKVIVVGVGAIGGLIGARLALAGHQLVFADKPDVIAALRTRGFTLIDRGGNSQRLHNLMFLSEADEVSSADFAVLAVKAHDIINVAPLIGSFTDRGIPLLTLQNGIPWWYFQRYDGELEGCRLECLDPDSRISRLVDPGHVIGCVAYPAAESVGMTTVRHVEGSGLPVGELDGRNTPRIEQIAAALRSAGFKSTVSTDIRSEIWLKVWGAVSFNPISALTGATMREICVDPMARRLVAKMMQEAQTVAEHLGVHFRVTLDRRIKGAERVGDHKTSMLQDREAGRRMEVEALIGAICEIGQALKIKTPTIDSMYALTRLLDGHITSSESG